MRLANVTRGQVVAPLDEVRVAETGGGEVVVTDGQGRVYCSAGGVDRLRFRVAGAAGWHRVEWRQDGEAVETHLFRVAAETRVWDDRGESERLLRLLLATMLRFGEVGLTVWNQRIYRFFVCWLRDHVHTLKGMKYFSGELRSAMEVYRDSQRADGMIWDNIQPRHGPEPNAWDLRFGYGGFIRPFEDHRGEFKRIPVENDVEYLFVEGLYVTWQATGDDGWMAGHLDAAIRALNYSVTDPYRWSREFGLLKRGFTIDTWDFQNDEDARLSAGGDPTMLAFGDAMAVRPETTRFGVMFGDNTGYIAACRQLAEMLERAGRGDQAAPWRERAMALQQRLDTVAWNGRHFRHHVPEHGVQRDLGVDLDAQVSLSNAYSLNRGVSHAQAVAIIQTYHGIRDHLPVGSPGEWYTIYPPFERGYGAHNAKWQYMNGGVTPIVAGELAHGCFEHGFERYGVDILRRVLALGEASDGHLHCAYTGSLPPPPERTLTPLDLRGYANTSFDGTAAPAPGWFAWTGEADNDLHELPVGEQTFAGLPWQIPSDPAACLGLGPERHQQVVLPVNRHVGALYLLHCVSNLPTDEAGTVTWQYADGTCATRHVLRGRHVAGWWLPEVQPGRPLVVAWRGRNAVCANVGLVAGGLDNPHSDRAVRAIVLRRNPAGGLWLVAGATLSEQPVWFPPNPISYGIPDNWGAAAVVYALLEGLVGVKDEDTAFESVLLAPRWPAADVRRAGATVTYPASGGYVAYTWQRVADGLRLTVAASGERLRLHLLLPDGVQVGRVTVNGAAVPFECSLVEESRYVDVELACGPLSEVVVGGG